MLLLHQGRDGAGGGDRTRDTGMARRGVTTTLRLQAARAPRASRCDAVSAQAVGLGERTRTSVFPVPSRGVCR